eukprot:1277114-Amphidinium_carterae.1
MKQHTYSDLLQVVMRMIGTMSVALLKWQACNAFVQPSSSNSGSDTKGTPACARKRRTKIHEQQMSNSQTCCQRHAGLKAKPGNYPSMMPSQENVFEKGLQQFVQRTIA